MTEAKPDGSGEFYGYLSLGDVIHYYDTIKPRWWQFWKSDKIEYRELEVTSVRYFRKLTYYEGRFVGP